MALAANGFQARAANVIDIQRYGDKELKIAAINKIKQLLRNELLQNPAQAAPWVRLAISDSLAFSAANDAGGPDASIQFEDSLLKSNRDLDTALRTLISIKKQVLKTTEVTLADVIAYAGAEAIEATGGPRIQVQVGRYDAPKPVAGAAPHLAWQGSLTSVELVRAFENSGFSAKEKVLLVAALGTVAEATSVATGGRASAVVDPDDDDDEMFPADGGIFIPQTFGSQKAMFGELISKASFDAAFLKDAIAGKAGEMGELAIGDNASKAIAQKYAAGKNGDALFRKDLSEAYIKVTTAGASVTGAKVLAP